MAVHFLDQIRDLGHRHAFLEHVDYERLQRIIRALIGCDRLLVEFAILVPWHQKLQVSVLRMECPRVGTVSGVTRVEADAILFFVIQESRQFGLEERIDSRFQVYRENFGDIFFFY